MWLLVAVRLAIPFAIESSFSLLPAKEYVTVTTYLSNNPATNTSGLTSLNVDKYVVHHFVKPLGFIITAVYWFNPLVWLAYILLCRDIELACDEKVIRKIGYNMKKSYSQVLLDLSVSRKNISACPVAFGEIGVDERVKNVLKMKKGKKIILAVALAVCGILAICFLTYPKMNSKDNAKEVATIATTEATIAETDKSEEAAKETIKETTESFEECIEDMPGDGSQKEVHVIQLKTDEGEYDITCQLEDDDEPQTIHFDEKTSAETGIEYVYIDPTKSSDEEVEIIYLED